MSTKSGARSGRMTVDNERDVVVFLIGMRINAWWRIHEWFPVAMAMPRMLKELDAQPELGLLGYEYGGLGNPTMMIQYWSSTDHLMEYAKARDRAHLPAWSEFNKRAAKTGAVGVWHETYPLRAGQYECVYVGMPPFGLGRVLPVVPAEGRRHGARGRLGQGASEVEAPVHAQDALPAE